MSTENAAAHGGPAHAPAGRTGSGLRGGSATRYRIDADGDGRVVRTPMRALDVVVTPDSRLEYAVFPVFAGDALAGGFAATAVSVDVEFDDGSWLSDSPAVDQAGYGASPAGQHASRALTVDQWNWRTVSLGGFAGRRAVAAHVAVLDDGTTRAGSTRPHGWVSEVTVAHTAAPAWPSLVETVDTRRGTNSSGDASRGNTVPAVAVPHGFNIAFPVTDAGTGSWPYRYQQHDDETGATPLEGFCVSHIPSPWMGDRGVLQIMPVRRGADADASRAARRRRFRHADETAHPHHYRVRFEDGDIAELAATDHCVLMRFTVPVGGGVVIDQVDDRGGLSVDPASPAAQVTGYTDFASDHVPANAPRMFFAIRFDQPVTAARTGVLDDRPDVSAALTVTPDAHGTVTVRIGTSFISVAQAVSALDQEVPAARTFQDVAADAATAWEDRLGVITVDGLSEDARVSFVSSLYRMFLYPNSATENTGTRDAPVLRHADSANPQLRAHAATETGMAVRDGSSFVNNGFWDTYRTVWPAYSLLAPDAAATMLDGFVEHFRASGWIERWSAPGAADCMVGTSSDIVTADAVAAGVTLPDLPAAYDCALRNATTPSEAHVTGRALHTRAMHLGYVPCTVPEGLSWTLESAVNDYGVMRLSEHLAAAATADDPRAAEYRANARYFRSRAAAYTTLFEAESAFFVGRHADGTFRTRGADVDPCVWGGDYTETNAWGMAFSVPHDGHGLAALHGGRDGLERKLDAYFSTQESGEARFAGTYGRVIHEMTEARDIRMGMFGISNQPAHHAPFMYAFTSAPHKAHAIVRESVRRLFLGSEIGQGYPGDEDNGEMSAWYVFASIGLYPLTPGSGELLLTSPSVERATITFPDGAATTIRAVGQSPEHVYIQRVTVDGEPWSSAAVPIALLRAGVTIDIELGPQPSAWASAPADAPTSLTAYGEQTFRETDRTDPTDARAYAAGSVDDAAALFDDDSSTGVTLAPGDWVSYRLGADALVGMYTVTAGSPTRASWAIEVSDDGHAWRVVDRHDDVEWRWSGQLRAFELPERVTSAMIRLRVSESSALEIRQLEFLG